MLKIVVITPYYKEPVEHLLQCHNSVLAQSYPCTHMLIADGYPRDIKTPHRTLHVMLPKSNADYGNTPRMIGGALADSYGFDAMLLLDSDNWFEPDHVKKMVEVYVKTKTPLVSCKRTFRHLDGTLLGSTEPQEDKFLHVDTNCWLIGRPAFPLLNVWAMRKEVCALGDRIFMQKAQLERYQITETDLRTVNYRTKNPMDYRRAGVKLPTGVYESDEIGKAYHYLRTPEGAIKVSAQIGFYPRLD